MRYASIATQPTPNSFVNQPGWRTLASAFRWTLDAGEPANFVDLISARALPTLIQAAEGDHTIPNAIFNGLAMLIARMEAAGVTVPDFAMPTFGADGYSTEIDSADQVLLMYSDVDGEREYEHDTLTVPTPRLFCLAERATTPCSPADSRAICGLGRWDSTLPT